MVEDKYLSVTEARKYIKETYGVSWSGAWIRELAHRGILRFVRPGAERGWMRISQASIDRRFQSPPDGSDSGS